MKGKIITERVYEGALAWTHGMAYEIKRILVTEADNLIITPHNNELYVWTGFEEKHEVIREIEVPEELVKKAIAFMQTKNELRIKFEALMAD